MASLAAVLVVTGWRLVHVGHVASLFRLYGPLPALIWATTLAVVVAEDLLTGVLVGIALSLLELLPHVRRLKLKVETQPDGEAHAIRLDGVASFLTLPRLSAALDAVPAHAPVRLDLSALKAVDHTSAELIRDWHHRRQTQSAAPQVTGAGGRLAALAAL
ncbi:hypothetical protein [Sphingomonas sp.]|uniref:hypothetical protein n=1 Tax=Sphingomonas sp. TaxID=28214 RepID=UPI002DB66EC4|nr:hypothetical protein [Sphingomonas sp.]HEU4968819.1 hypothetical protein [Sphingomonas sp.]